MGTNSKNIKMSFRALYTVSVNEKPAGLIDSTDNQKCRKMHFVNLVTFLRRQTAQPNKSHTSNTLSGRKNPRCNKAYAAGFDL